MTQIRESIDFEEIQNRAIESIQASGADVTPIGYINSVIDKFVNRIRTRQTEGDEFSVDFLLSEFTRLVNYLKSIYPEDENKEAWEFIVQRKYSEMIARLANP